jgi:hypothetical protein
MGHLPAVDVHARRVAATPERTWDALVKWAGSGLTRPAPAAFVALWRLEPTSGFAIAERDAPRRLALRGRHRFSRYELAFEVEPHPDGVTVSAHTSAEFPGVAGRIYRAAVIGSGGHRFFVRRMLEQIAQAAEHP